MLAVPTLPQPNQQLQVTLAGQAITLNIYQTAFGLFMDVLLNGSVVIAGVICENLNRIVRDAYLGLVGDFVFVDTQGTTDPVFTGLNSRYILIYLEASDFPGVLAT